MPIQHSNLILEFLDESPDGLRSIKRPNSSVECLVCSRSWLEARSRDGAAFQSLDVPGVYLLIGPPDPTAEHADARLYIGQADSVRDRLESHLRSESKRWWRTVAVLRQSDRNPLNLSNCRFLESKLYSLALNAQKCTLVNKVAPQPPILSKAEQNNSEDFLEKALVIVTALEWNFFRTEQQPAAPPTDAGTEPDGPPTLPVKLQPILEGLRNATTGTAFPRAQWYWTRTPDYRVKVVKGDDFRVFARIRPAKSRLRLCLKDVGEYKIESAAGLNDKVRLSIDEAYNKAVQYLDRRS